jgi:acyl-CoA hydrolase/GNAT superfamily N-acetyltransferase
MATDGYADKVITAEQAARLVKPGDRVFVGTACATPRSILEALERLDPPPPDVVLHHLLTTGVYEPGASPGRTQYEHRALFIGTDMKPLVPSGMADYVPVRLLEVPRLLESRRIPIDLAFIQVSKPDVNGFVSLGISVDVTMAMVRHARMVVAEINPHMPWTHGDTFIPLSRIAHVVPVDRPLQTFTHSLADDIARQIARYLAGIIDDGSTLQVGLGRIPNEALRYLGDRRDLGIHSDVITDGVVELIRAHAVTGARKTVHRGQVVASFAIGSQELYAMVDRNPMFLFLPVEEVCDPAVIAAQHRMVSMTQAFAMDLTGQTSIDQFEGEFYGGVSTQPDFMRGASLARDGKPIICMASTTDDGKTSRIRPLLAAGDGVGIPRSDVHYVVTEYGIAYLFGKSIHERALALAEIAHPSFRPWLLEEGKRLGYVTTKQRPTLGKRYQIEEERTVELKGGRAVLLRPAKAIDARALQGLFHRLPPQDVYTRFFRRLKSLSFEEAQNLCNVDQEAEVAFVAVTGWRENESVVGSACYFVNQTTNMAETAFMIDPAWQGAGLGRALQQRMKEHAMARGLRGFIAEVLATNERMIRLAQAASDDVRIEGEGDTCRIRMLF